MRRFSPVRTALLAFIIISSACNNPKPEQQDSKMPQEVFTEKRTILISKSYNEGAYEKWIGAQAPNFEFVEAYGMEAEKLAEVLSACHGILLTGGKDVSPEKYGMSDEMGLCGERDPYRDSLEIYLVNFALEEDIPLLGVCRGMQLMNVAMGGTLTMDLPVQKGTTIHQIAEGDAVYEIAFVQDDYNPFVWLNGTVNSNHHQAIDRLAKPLVITGYAPDGVPEAVVILDTVDYPFFLGVQWHPERMDPAHQLSSGPAREFIKAVLK
jgi:putative glutamine amidotransferase